MTESWEEKTERLEREYQARIDKLRKELREMEEQKLHIESLLDDRVRQCGLFESTNDALRQRLAELERDARLYVAIKEDWKELRIQQKRTIQRLQSQLATKDKRVAELEAKQCAHEAELAVAHEFIADLQSQLAWAPVSAGLPTEPGYYLFGNDEPNLMLYRRTTHAEWAWESVSGAKFTSERMCETYECYRRIELSKDGES